MLGGTIFHADVWSGDGEIWAKSHGIRLCPAHGIRVAPENLHLRSLLLVLGEDFLRHRGRRSHLHRAFLHLGSGECKSQRVFEQLHAISIELWHSRELRFRSVLTVPSVQLDLFGGAFGVYCDFSFFSGNADLPCAQAVPQRCNEVSKVVIKDFDEKFFRATTM